MQRRQDSKRRRPLANLARVVLVTVMAGGMLVVAAPASADPPTTNGLFFGDGDDGRYVLYNSSALGSSLYYHLAPDYRLHVALVVGRNVNDNVFAPGGNWPSGNRAYTQDAGWGPPRPANRLVDSEYAAFSLTCGSSQWTWQQGYGGQPDSPKNFTNPTWYSDHTVAGGSGAPPPGITSASSFAWNVNNYAARLLAADTPGWDLGALGTGIDRWHSPFRPPPDQSQVIGLDGYPASGAIGFSSVYQWEWPMVYEWSVPLDPVCVNNTPFVITGLSHHSPGKGGDEDDPFPPPPNGGALRDHGDLPAVYGVAGHDIVIGGPRLGTIPPDAEPGAQHSDDARGDDISGSDDEDGIVFLTPLVPGGSADVQVTVTGDGFVSGFIDFDGDGVLDPVTYSAVDSVPAAGSLADVALSTGVYVFTIDVPSSTTGFAYSRWRITTSAGTGGASPTGTAPSGEVEDYRVTASVGDFVWNDLDADGVQDPGEPGIDGATVNLWRDVDGDGIYETFVASTVTAAGGLYNFDGLPGGRYRVTVDPTTVPSDFVATTTNPLPFVLSPGENREDVDFGFAPASVIGNWVWIVPFGIAALALGWLSRRGRRPGRGRIVMERGV